MRGRTLILLLVLLGMGILWASCSGEKVEKLEKRSSKKSDIKDECALVASKIHINEDSKNIIYTWVDANGEFHSTEKVDEIPVEFSNDVLITDLAMTPEQRKSDKCAIVADIQRKDEKGFYILRAEPRADFERAIRLKRKYKLSTVSALAGAMQQQGITPKNLPKNLQNNDKVILYSTSWCGYCKKLRGLLKQMQIPFIDKDVEKDPAAAAELAAKTQAAGIKNAGVPVLDYMGTLIVGYDPQALQHAIKAHGIPSGIQTPSNKNQEPLPKSNDAKPKTQQKDLKVKGASQTI